MNLRKRFSFVIVSGIIGIIFIATFQGIGFTPEPTAVTPPMDGVMVLMLLDNDFDDNEYMGAKNKLVSFGCTIVNTATENTVESFGGTYVTVDLLFAEVDVDDYDCIYVPGGLAPDILITKQAVLTFIQDANAKGLALAGICSGPLVFAAADIVDGKNVTGNISVQKELVEAGGNFIGGPCVRDGNLITADNPYMDFTCFEIAKVLGYFEEDPPEIGEVTYTIGGTEASISCYLEVEITDFFGVQFVRATAYKYENNHTEKKLVKQVLLKDPDQDEVFNNTITGLENGEHCITLFVPDILGNEFTNESFLELNLLTTENSALEITFVSMCTMIFLACYSKRRRKSV